MSDFRLVDKKGLKTVYGIHTYALSSGAMLSY